MNEEIDDIIERLARIVEAAQPRKPTKQLYRLDWTPMVPYTEANIEAVKSSGVGSCVYEIWERRDGKRTAVYVGETKALGARLEQHMQDSEENEHLRNADFSKLFFSYAPLTGPIARKTVERALWKLYSYAWNDEDGPKGMGVEGTVSVEEHFPEAYTINFNGTRKPMTGVTSPVTLP